MSSGQRARTPEHFPRMKLRGNRRRIRRFFSSTRSVPWVIYRDTPSIVSEEIR